MEVTIRVRRCSVASAPEVASQIRRSRRPLWRYLGAAALATAALLTISVAGRVRAARDQPGGPAAPVLEVTSLSVRREGTLAIVEGTVRNRSSEPLEYVWVRASFEDERGNTVSHSDDALIESVRLAPGEAAPFRLYGVWNPAIAQCDLRFTRMAQVALPASGALAPVPRRVQ
jgi:hypothetical protein